MHGISARTGALAAGTVVLVAALPPGPYGETVASEGPATEGTAVRSFWSTLDSRWNGRDAEGFSNLFTEDVSFEFVDRGELLESRATVRQHFGERFPTFAPDIRHLTTIRHIRNIAPDILAVDGRVEILREGTETLRTFAIFAVMVRQAEEWKIRMIRIYALPAAAANVAADRVGAGNHGCPSDRLSDSGMPPGVPDCPSPLCVEV